MAFSVMFNEAILRCLARIYCIYMEVCAPKGGWLLRCFGVKITVEFNHENGYGF